MIIKSRFKSGHTPDCGVVHGKMTDQPASRGPHGRVKTFGTPELKPSQQPYSAPRLYARRVRYPDNCYLELYSVLATYETTISSQRAQRERLKISLPLISIDLFSSPTFRVQTRLQTKQHLKIQFTMGNLNLEVFKFGVYIMFPIAFMYYYGTNLDNRFTTPDFWPSKPEQTNRLPYERDEIKNELERLKEKRLYLREKRLREEKLEAMREGRSTQE